MIVIFYRFSYIPDSLNVSCSLVIYHREYLWTAGQKEQVCDLFLFDILSNKNVEQ